MLVVLLKIAAIVFVGLIILIGLLINGDKIYPWLEGRYTSEREELQKTLDLMFIQIELKKINQMYIGYLLFLFFIAFVFFYPNVGAIFFFGTAFCAGGFKIPLFLVKLMHAQRIKKFVLQMVDGLALMSNAMRSGLNVPQALQLVSDELPNPISQEFQLILSQNKLGVTLEDAIGNLSQRMPQDDVEMFTTSVNILKETGGNLAETFDTISNTIRERIKIEAKISAMVTQGILQGVIVTLMPFALGGMLYVVDPERMTPMFTTAPGWILIIAMMMLQALGGYVIWKVVQIRV